MKVLKKKFLRIFSMVVVLLLLVTTVSCRQQSVETDNDQDKSEQTSKDDKDSKDIKPSEELIDIEIITSTEFSFEDQEAFSDAYETFMENNISTQSDDAFFEMSDDDRDEMAEETERMDEIESTDEMPETSYSLVFEAFESGEISEMDFSYYTVLSSYRPDLLPEEFSSAYPFGLTIQRQIQYLVDHWDELDDDRVAEIEPYLVPINDERSIFNVKSTSRNDGGSSADTSSFVVYASDLTTFADSHTVDNVVFTILYPSSNASSSEVLQYYDARMADIKQALDDAYNRYKTLLGTGITGPVLVELVPMGSAYGEAWGDGTQWRIKLNSNLMKNSKVTKSTMVHELFHLFQFEIGLTGSGGALDWASEATATWSEHFIYPSYNSEHEYLGAFFSTLHKHRVGAGNNFDYGSYMFFYYLTDYADSSRVIKDFIYVAANGGASAIRSFFGNFYSDFEMKYAKFALYNIDTEPLVYYHDHGFLQGMPNGTAFKFKRMGGKQKDEKDVKLNGGSIQYYYYVFDDVEDAAHIKFEMDPILDDDVRRQAAIRAEGEWRIEDWTDEIEKIFCRESKDPLEHVDQVILFYSNADFTDTTAQDVDEFTVETDNCPDKVKITMEGTYAINGYGNSWDVEFKIVDYSKVVEHDLFISYDCSYEMKGVFKSEGVTYMVTDGQSHHTIPEEMATLEDGFPRVFYPGALGNKEFYDELSQYGIDENLPEKGLLVTIPFFDDIDGSTTFYFPPPIGTTTESTPFPFDGITMVASIELPENIRDGREIEFSRTIDVQSYTSPIQSMYTLDLATFSSQMEGLGIPTTTMPDMSEIELPEGMEMPEGFEMPEIEDPTADMMNGLMGIMNPSSTGYTTILTVNVNVEWPEE